MIRKVFLLLAMSIGISIGSHSQSISKIMRQQKANIQAAYKRGRITEREYYKLMDEQETIRRTVEKYNSDGYLTYSERDKIAGKQQRAAGRLRKYRINNEHY